MNLNFVPAKIVFFYGKTSEKIYSLSWVFFAQCFVSLHVFHIMC